MVWFGDVTGEEGIVSNLFNSWLPPCIAATFPTLLARYMRSNVYVTAGCPVDRQQRRRAAGLLLSARRGQQLSMDSWHAL